MPKPLTYNAELVRRDDFTRELTVFHLRYDEPLPGSFVPGQYVALGLNNDDHPALGSVRRSMSIASAPEEGDTLQFYVRFVKYPESENPLTHLLWRMKVGDRIFMTRKPVGKFTLPDTTGASDPRLKLLVAAGTGLAPFVSMARSRVAQDPSADLGDLAILHGASYAADLVFRVELSRYRDENGLRYLPTVSRPGESADWSGATGRVEDFFLHDRIGALEADLGLSPGELAPERAAVLICGLQGTIANTITRLAHRGFVPHDRKIRRALEVPEEQAASMWWEQYDTTPVIDIDDAAVVEALKGDLLPALSGGRASTA